MSWSSAGELGLTAQIQYLSGVLPWGSSSGSRKQARLCIGREQAGWSSSGQEGNAATYNGRQSYTCWRRPSTKTRPLLSLGSSNLCLRTLSGGNTPQIINPHQKKSFFKCGYRILAQNTPELKGTFPEEKHRKFKETSNHSEEQYLFKTWVWEI